MTSQGSAVRPNGLELHSCLGIRRVLTFALVLFSATASILLSSSSEMPRTATLSNRVSLSTSRVAKAYGKLPLGFELNQGQTDPRVKFLSRGSGYSLFLTGNEAVLRLRKSSPPPETMSTDATNQFSIGRLQRTIFGASGAAKHIPAGADEILHMRLIGANAKAEVTGLEKLPGRSNYFIGNDSKKWRTDVPNYARVRYANVYPGVDLVYYGNQRQLEYDFVVRPGADLHQIGLDIRTNGLARSKGEDGSPLRTNPGGDLIVAIDSGEVIFHKPIVYQPALLTQLINNDRNHRTWDKQFIDGKYVVKGERVTFEVASYDKTRPLVIDPTLAYATYLGGTDYDFGQAIAVDSSGNAYVTGSTASAIFPTTADAFQITLGGPTSNAFVSKLNRDGSALLYSTYLGGNGLFGDGGNAVAVDASGNAFVTGSAAPNFPTTPGAFQSTYTAGSGCSPSCSHAFITKLNASGSRLVYSTYLSGANDFDRGNGIAIDSSGNAYVAGITLDPTFPTTPGAAQTTIGGGNDAFVTKLNAAGSALIYSTFLGGPDFDEAGAIAVDGSNNAYVTGTTVGDFPITPGSFQPTSHSGDAFVVKLNAAGSALVYSTYLGGSGSGGYGQAGNGIAVDASGNAYVAGETNASDFPTVPGSFQTTYGGNEDAFVTKLNAAGSALVYSTFLGGSNIDWAFGITLDASGDAYVTGQTYSSNFPTTPDAFQGSLAYVDAFITKLNNDGSALVYSTYLGGNSYSGGNGVALDGSGNAYVGGYTGSSNFPVTPGAFQTVNGGYYDAFVSKFSFVVPFSRFGGHLLIDPDAGVFNLSGGFKLGPAGRIDPSTQAVIFSVGSYSVTLPPGSFVRSPTGYVYQKGVNGIFLRVFIKFTRTPGTYQLLANRIGGTLNITTSPVPVTLTIGDNSGSTQINATFD